MTDSQDAFEAAHADVRGLTPPPSQGVALQLYAYFQQAVVGDNTTEPPADDDSDARAKWNLWAGMKGMSRQEARSEYIALVENLKRLAGR
ncbi:acyl-CoA-binding protein [Nocardia goodfellowii]|uniref:Acyl-CoA-binding protein n=1 Tax=Nocardia goodfellowii TaxID=882446 RepID=A0ABS4QNM7_9NOCA|nr:acyl-CoA-binding protein [Nocardia goodfellowii]MBP2193315.1 acyl-CoA-binding protein [Nocardia goodfellowii]